MEQELKHSWGNKRKMRGGYTGMCTLATKPWSWELPLSQLEPRGLSRTQLGFPAMAGDGGQAKQRPRLFCHKFQTLRTWQTPEHFQINKQDPTEQIYTDDIPGLLWGFGAHAHHQPQALGNRGATSPNVHMLHVAAGQGWVIRISLQQCTLSSCFHLRGHGWDWERVLCL